jgi:hypothetical protein
LPAHATSRMQHQVCCKRLQGSEPPSSRSVHLARLRSATGNKVRRSAAGELLWNFHRCIRCALQLNWHTGGCLPGYACMLALACTSERNLNCAGTRYTPMTRPPCFG